MIFASYGNDSVALIQWAREKGLKNVAVVYSDTGWAAEHWPARVDAGEQWAQSLGFSTYRTTAEGGGGFLALVDRKSAWPRGGGGKYQFCTGTLKELPAVQWLEEHDPDGLAVCMVGIRRVESANRANFPEWTEESPKHGGRQLWAPLVRHFDLERNDLLKRTPLPWLRGRSQECSPCVNAPRRVLATLPESRIKIIEAKEAEMGTNSRGNPVVMFSPSRYGGAVGIREVVKVVRGAGVSARERDYCDGGWCGS